MILCGLALKRARPRDLMGVRGFAVVENDAESASDRVIGPK